MKTKYKAGDVVHLNCIYSFSVSHDISIDLDLFKRNVEKYISLNLDMLLGFKSYKFNDFVKEGGFYGKKKTHG